MTTNKITHSDMIEVLGTGGFFPMDDADAVVTGALADSYAAAGWDAVAYDDGAEEPGLLFVKWSADGIVLLATDLRGIPTDEARFPFTVRGLEWLAGAINEGASYGSAEAVRGE